MEIKTERPLALNQIFFKNIDDKNHLFGLF